MKLSLLAYLILIAFSLAYTLTLFLSDFYSPALFLIKSFTFQVFSFCIALNILFTIVLRRQKYILLISFLSNSLLLTPLITQYSHHRAATNETVQFELTSFSALTRTRNGRDIIKYVQDNKPEILCLQEVIKQDTDKLDEYYDYICLLYTSPSPRDS